MPADLDAAADELYAGTREDFTPRRKELSKEAKTAGDTTLAAAIDKLAKPTTSAWIANQLARDGSSDVDQVATLGESLRKAHTDLDGAELRTLSQQRTKLVNTLIRQAGKVAQLTESVTRELEDIFTTAIADPEVARVLLAGRLTSAKDLAAAAAAWPSSDASAGVADTLAASVAARPKKPKQDTAELDRKREAARRELDEAKAAVKEAEADRKEEERILEQAQHAVDEATERVRRVYEELDAAEAEEKEARRRVGSASRSVKDAERRAGQAWRTVQQTEQKLADLKD
ncbi:hypothetical protein [Actinophytocola oryzae]|uniref:Uncharacterized protein n=1 Tax=Actinophytocola oryzae TaxID=502181 RepID=A0A4R7VBH8_9PSEU|nr:hypothetical protein [Actinophytocola oryzae]TDV46335.1 hypothetical protein CLV71_111294 [Actinophytocola oryzae]